MSVNELQKTLAERDFELSKLKRQLSRLQSKMERDKAVSASLSAVSAMRTAERERQEQYLTLLLDHSPDIIILLDRSGRFAFCTKFFLEKFGIAHMGLVQNKSFREVFETYVGAELSADILTALETSMRDGGAVQLQSVLPIIGDERVFNVRIAPLHAFTGEIVSSVVMMHDITEIRRAQENAERERETAQEASRAKSTFLSNMSHEMRTPMNAIIGMTAIGRGAGDINRKDYCFGKIEEASTHLLGVINDILDISKIEAQKFELSPVEFDFERMLRKAVSVVYFRAEEKSQTFDVRLDEKIPDILKGDDQRLAQVVTNLLSNAVKFTPESGTIKLLAELISRAGDECLVRVSVTDTGIGISPDQQKRLFNSFEQADSGTSRKFGGTGLGLAISKNIVEMMGGSMRVESELGIGSTFAFTVRLGIADQSTQRSGKFPPGVSLKDLRVLVVDDSEDVLDYFLEISRKFGFECEAAIGGREALALVDMRGGYDMYFVDWKMPDMNGVELSRKIAAREMSEKAFIVMISGVDWNVIEDEAREAGIERFMNKPIFPSAIADVINDCLGLHAYEPASAGEVEADGQFTGRRVLFAEDVDVNREILIALLEPTGIELICAENGVRAVELFREDPLRFDLVLMDMQMPEMDGIEATRRIRAEPNNWAKNIPIVAMTANVFREDVEMCLAAGMNDHIGKPVNISEVIEKIKQYLPWANAKVL